MAAVRETEPAQPTPAPTNNSLKTPDDSIHETVLKTDSLKEGKEDQVLFSCNICYEVITLRAYSYTPV